MTASPPAVPLAGLPARLRPEVHLFGTGDEWLLAEPHERFTRLVGPAEVVRALQPELHGGPRRGEGREEGRDGVAGSLRTALLQALTQRRVLDDSGVGGSPRARVLVSGAGDLADLVRAAFGPWADVLTDPVGGDVALETWPPHDVLVTCAGWLPDRRFRALDERSRRDGIAWHHCHHEPGALSVGPLQVPGGAAYRDWRGRRLAASTTPAELRAFWTHLDDPAVDLPEVPATDRGRTLVAAGLLVDDVQRWWEERDRAAVAVEHLVRRDERDALSVSHHPVLPLPVP